MIKLDCMLNRIKTYLRSLARRGDIDSVKETIRHLDEARERDVKLLNETIRDLYSIRGDIGSLRDAVWHLYNVRKKDAYILKNAIGHLCVQDLRRRKDLIQNINDAEFCIYSQFGEDGIICYLVESIPIENKYFVEFGVENYEEANTRFLLIYYNWSGLVMDVVERYIEDIKSSEVYWRYDLKAINAFITKNNINELLKNNVPYEDIGLLSIDIDGMDYWVWESIEVVKPRIVICEYNALFGYKKAITIPYSDDFERFRANPSGWYFGASLKALVNLAKRKGYIFVGCDSNGVNAFFVREDVKGNLREVSIEEGYKPGKFKQIKTSAAEAVEMLKDMEVYDVEENKTYKISQILDYL